MPMVSSVMLDHFLPMIAQAVANSLWQGALIGLFLWLVLSLCRRWNATTRYWVLLTCGALILCLFVVDFFRPVSPQPSMMVPVTTLSNQVQPEPVSLPHFILPVRLGWILASVWLLMAGLKIVQLVRGWYCLERLKTNSIPVEKTEAETFAKLLEESNAGREVELRRSSEIAMPVTVGFRHPYILVPDTLDRLSEPEMRQVLMHELAHVCRRDDWTKLSQKGLEAIFFFHPILLWIGKQLDLEREIACDDAVVLQTGCVRPYALCLTKFAELSEIAENLRTPAVAFSRNQLSRRIDMLLDKKREVSLGISRIRLFSTLFGFACLFVLMIYAAPLVAVGVREHALDSIRIARDQMKQAEDNMWKAADEKLKAMDEQSLKLAEDKAMEAMHQMEMARHQMEMAKEEMKEAGHENEGEAVAGGISGGIEGAVEEGIEDGIEDGVKDGVEGAMDDAILSSGYHHNPCPAEMRIKVQEERLRIKEQELHEKMERRIREVERRIHRAPVAVVVETPGVSVVAPMAPVAAYAPSVIAIAPPNVSSAIAAARQVSVVVLKLPKTPRMPLPVLTPSVMPVAPALPTPAGTPAPTVAPMVTPVPAAEPDCPVRAPRARVTPAPDPQPEPSIEP
jgi:beta-lactamase regulating signal transducer with metallopeptidase domain